MYPRLKNDYDLIHKMSNIDTRGASVIGAVNTSNGFTTLTFRKDLFKRNICQSASVNCYRESGNSLWGQAMEMAQHVCDLARGNKLPPGVSVSYK